MPTKFKEGTGWAKRATYHAYALVVNSTEIGVWAAASISVTTLCNVDVKSVVREGATYAALYLVPAAPLYTYVKQTDKAIAAGKKVYTYGSIFYKKSRSFTSPVEFCRYIGSQAITKFGVTEGMKKLCGVEEDDLMYYEREQK